MLELGAEARKIEVVHIVLVKEDDAVGVAHRDAGHVIDLFVYDERGVDDGTARHVDRDLCRLEDRRAHIDASRLHFAVPDVQLERFYAGKRVDGNGGAPADHAVVIQILADAADAVAAHFTLRAVGVEDAHLRIRPVGRGNEDNAVATDAEMRFGKRDGQLFGVRDLLVEAVDIDVIVAAAVHFSERQLHTVSLQLTAVCFVRAELRAHAPDKGTQRLPRRHSV